MTDLVYLRRPIPICRTLGNRSGLGPMVPNRKSVNAVRGVAEVSDAVFDVSFGRMRFHRPHAT